MIKNTFVALVLLAGASRAQLVTPGAAATRAWSGPVAGAVSAAGLDAVNGLGSVSLSRLSAPDAGGTILMLKTPALLGPMTATLIRAGHTPESFAARPTAEKLSILASAAKLAETDLAEQAAFLAQGAADGVKRSNAEGLSKSVVKARALDVYLDAAAKEKLAAAEKAVNAYQAIRSEAVRAFLEDLPKKMTSGEFDGKTWLKRVPYEGTWRTADSAPDEIFVKPEGALAARVKAVQRMPAGPWSVAEADILSDALTVAVEKRLVSDPSWIEEMSRRLTAAKKRGAAAAAAGTLGRAAASFDRSGRLNGKQIMAIEKYYAGAVESSSAFELDSQRVRARVLAGVQTGGAGLPGWPAVQAAKRAFVDRMQKLAIRAGAVWGILMSAMIAASSFDVLKVFGGWGAAAFVLAMMSPIFVFCWAIWQRDAHTGGSPSFLGEMMRRYFKGT